MNNTIVQNTVINPKLLWFLTLTYNMIIALANWFDPRLITIVGINTTAGTIIFPFSYIISDMITEVYGYQYTRRTIWCGFLFSIIFALYGFLITQLPSPAYSQEVTFYFDKILSLDYRIMFASAISYLLSEPTNALIMAKSKLKFSGEYLGIRILGSSLIASSIDSITFVFIAFVGTMTLYHLFELIKNVTFLKLFIETSLVFFSIRLINLLKKYEEIDMFDINTNFNFFKLSVVYDQQNNQFKGEDYE